MTEKSNDLSYPKQALNAQGKLYSKKTDNNGVAESYLAGSFI